MILPTTFQDIISEASQLELYAKLIKQLNKDFLLANIDLDFEDNIPPEDLKRNLHEIIYKLILEKFAEYLNLLYIIDVPENQIKNLDGNDALLLSENVSFLILKREWQKVWYKDNFS